MPRRKRTHKVRTFIFFLVLIAAAGIIGFLVYQSYFAKSPEPTQDQTPTVQQATTKSVTTTATQNASESTTAPEPDKTPAKYDGNSPNNNSSLTGAITYARKNGNKLTIRINIDQYLTAGSCNLILSQNNSSVYVDSAHIIDGASTSTCAGFDIPVDNLSGHYIITVNLDSSGKTGQIRGEVTL